MLLKMGEKGNDGGQFFTPREVIRAMVRVVDPKIGQTVYDPGCGTCGFLAQAYEYMRDKAGDRITGPQLETLKRRTFYGREKGNTVHPIALANLGEVVQVVEVLNRVFDRPDGAQGGVGDLGRVGGGAFKEDLRSLHEGIGHEDLEPGQRPHEPFGLTATHAGGPAEQQF